MIHRKIIPLESELVRLAFPFRRATFSPNPPNMSPRNDRVLFTCLSRVVAGIAGDRYKSPEPVDMQPSERFPSVIKVGRVARLSVSSSFCSLIVALQTI